MFSVDGVVVTHRTVTLEFTIVRIFFVCLFLGPAVLVPFCIQNVRQ